jgi:hypothetical protein
VRMAKASEDDFKKTIAFFQFVEEYRTYTPDRDAEPVRITGGRFLELLQKLWGGRFKPPGVDACWSRVVFGCQILIENVCDPDKNYLDWKPEFVKLIEPAEGIVDALDGEQR